MCMQKRRSKTSIWSGGVAKLTLSEVKSVVKNLFAYLVKIRVAV